MSLFHNLSRNKSYRDEFELPQQEYVDCDMCDNKVSTVSVVECPDCDTSLCTNCQHSCQTDGKCVICMKELYDESYKTCSTQCKGSLGIMVRKLKEEEE